MSLAVSTSWNAFRSKTAKDLLFEIKKLGFEELELSFNLSSALLDEIKKYLSDAGLRIVSLHNFCPIPDGFSQKEALPDSYSMSSLNEEERALSLKFTKRTIDTAVSVGAKAVVLHTGRVEMHDVTRELIRLCEEGKKDTNDFNLLKERTIKDRAGLIRPHFEKVLLSLSELNDYSCKKGVKLGVETRFYYREIPNLEEIGVILDNFKDSSVFYWHDTGHAHVMEKLGFASQKQFLDLYGSSMIGVHLHDYKDGSDHKAPAIGEINFGMLKPYLKKDTIKVMEAHHPATTSELIKSKVFLEKTFDDKG